MTNQRPVVFHIDKTYQLRQKLGEGAYGVVCSAVHRPTGIKVAIKKIEPFSKNLVCLRTIRELKLLNFFSQHENIIGFYDVLRPRSLDTFHEVYLVQEFMPTDLHKLIYSQVVLDQHIKYFVYQIIRGLKAIHSANVIHRDLKPSNILVNYNCDVKICDFGLARIHSPNHKYSLLFESKLTEYVATRWYRAPEIMLLQSLYSTAIDLWSVGCIMAEIFLCLPLFPGKDYKHQLMLIFEFLGTPTAEELDSVKLLRARDYIKLLPCYDAVHIADYFSHHPRRIARYGYEPINSAGLDLMEKLLSFDPSDRPDATEALAHEYLEEYHDENDEPASDTLLVPEFFDLEEKNTLSMPFLRKHLYDQIMYMTR